MELQFRKPEEVIKGWNKEVVFANNSKYCGKLLCFNKGKKCSTHYHYVKEESFYLFKGQIVIRYYDLTNADKKERILNEGDVVDIPPGCPHQMEALVDSIIIEVSTHDDPADSYRVEKGNSQL